MVLELSKFCTECEGEICYRLKWELSIKSGFEEYGEPSSCSFRCCSGRNHFLRSDFEFYFSVRMSPWFGISLRVRLWARFGTFEKAIIGLFFAFLKAFG